MKKTPFTYKGLLVPVFTPFNNDANRSLNLSIIPAYAKFLMSKSLTGILVNGTTGEGTSLTVDERKKVAEAWANAVKHTSQHLMIQVGGTSLIGVKELAAHAEMIGADSILCLPELYFRPSTANDLIEYLKVVSEAAPRTPLFYYDFPRASMVNIDMEEMFNLIDGRVSTFCGIKTDLERGISARQANDSYTILLAGDMLMIGGCATGIKSYVMTCLNFIPELAFELLKFGEGNIDLNSARRSQEQINEIVSKITRYGSWIETMKIAMNLVTGIFVGPPRAPLKLLSQEASESMNKNLIEIGLETNEISLIDLFGESH